MQLKSVAPVMQGSILTRIKSTGGNATMIPSVTMQGLSYYLNLSDQEELETGIKVSLEKVDSCCFACKGDVVIGLSSGKAMAIDENTEGKIVLSNFALVKLSENNNVNPNYFCWYINENPEVQKLIAANSQGSARVRIIPLGFISELPINIIPLEKQVVIGKLYDLNRKRTRIIRTLEKKKEDLNLIKILKYYEGE